MNTRMDRTPLAVATAALLALTILSGCQALDGVTQGGNPDPAQTGLADTAPAPKPGGTAVARADPAAPPVNDDPMQFMGLQGAAIAAQLGKPDLIRRDSGVEVRQFRGDACTLDLFLYPAGNDLAVKHVELRGASLDNDARRACLAEMIRERTLAG